MTEVIFLLIAFMLALFLIVAIVVVVGIASLWPGRVFRYLMLLITGVSIGWILLTERVLRAEEYGLSISSDADIGGTIFSKFLLIIIVGCAFALCIAWFFISTKKKLVFSRFGERGLTEPNEIVISFMVFFIAFSLIPLLFGQKFYFHVSLVYPFFVFLALFLWVRLSDIDPVIVAKQCLGLVVIGSLGSAIFMQDLAIQPGYQSYIPGFNFRLWGVTPHANSLGAMAATFLFLEAAEPSERRWLRNCIFATAAATLVMTQSKTSIMAALFGVLVLAIWRRSITSKQKLVSGMNKKNQFGVAMIAISAVMIITAGAWLLLADDLSFIETLEHNLGSRGSGSTMSASGRTAIWAVAIDGGMENPLFGQGASFWLETRQLQGLSGASSAHNVFMQTFSRSGFLGLAALLVFFFFLLQYSIRASKITRGASIAFMVLFFTRGMFEASIQPNLILGGEFLAMMTLFFYVTERGAKPIKEVQGSK